MRQWSRILNVLTDEEFEAEPVGFALQFIDVLFPQDHGIRELTVAFDESAQGFLQCCDGELSHFCDLAANAGNVALERSFVMWGHAGQRVGVS